jgi:hypothetical protein
MKKKRKLTSNLSDSIPKMTGIRKMTAWETFISGFDHEHRFSPCPNCSIYSTHVHEHRFLPCPDIIVYLHR